MPEVTANLEEIRVPAAVAARGKKPKLPGCFIGLATLLVVASAANADYIAGRDLLNDINSHGGTSADNPNGAWSYGYETAPSVGFTLYNTFTTTLVSPHTDIAGWEVGATNVPDASVNTTGTTESPQFAPTDLTLSPNEMFVHPGTSTTGGPFTVVRWTAPSSGTYSVTTDWRLLNAAAVGDSVYVYDTPLSTGVPVLLYNNGGSLAAYNASGTPTVYSAGSLVLASGDILDFITGPKTSSVGPPIVYTNVSDHTGFQATITPEPAGALLMGVFGVGLLALRRR